MNKNKRIMRISLVVMIISALISIIAIKKLMIDKPVFLINYCEIGTYENQGIYPINQDVFILKYISNVDDKRYVTGISFEELPDSNFFASEYSSSGGQSISEYGRYGIHTVYLSCPDFKFEDDVKEVTLTEATVEFDDGLKMDIDLGKIILYKEKERPVAIEHISTRGVSDGTASSDFRISEDVTIERVNSPLFKEALEVFDINISAFGYNDNVEINYTNGEEVMATDIKGDSTITFAIAYKGSEDILKSYTIYDIKPKIHFVNEYNDEYSIRYHNMRNDTQYYSYHGIYKYLKARGEL